MFSSTSLILFGVIALIAVVVIWKWWKSPVTPLSKKDDDIEIGQQRLITENSSPPEVTQQSNAPPPPMVFAVNDGGNLDLADISGKILNIGYGPNPKTYIGLLDAAEKDTVKLEHGSQVQFESNVGNTKLYEVAGRPYIINYTRLRANMG